MDQIVLSIEPTLHSKCVNAEAKVTHSYIDYDLDEKHASDFSQLTPGIFLFFKFHLGKRV